MAPTRPPPAIRALLIDISGTLLVGTKPTPGAAAALARLRDSQVSFRLCSNTSKESTAALRARLCNAGFDVRPDEVSGRRELWTSLGAVGGVMEARGLKRPYFLLSDSAREDCTSASTYDPSPAVPYDAVIVGLAPSLLSYEHLNEAFRILVGEHPSQKSHGDTAFNNVPLIALHKARTIQSSDGALSLGPGPFVSALETASRRDAEVVGKPTRAFFETVIMNFQPEESFRGSEEGKVAVIGDDVQADLGDGAVELGLWRILVKTGKYRPGAETAPGVAPPDEVCTSFAAFVDRLLGSEESGPSAGPSPL